MISENLALRPVVPVKNKPHPPVFFARLLDTFTYRDCDAGF